MAGNEIIFVPFLAHLSVMCHWSQSSICFLLLVVTLFVQSALCLSVAVTLLKTMLPELLSFVI